MPYSLGSKCGTLSEAIKLIKTKIRVLFSSLDFSLKRKLKTYCIDRDE